MRDVLSKIAENERPTALGQSAPEFTLRENPQRSVSLKDFRGKFVVLLFYPSDWSPVCGSELSLFNELVPTFSELGAVTLGISVDSPWSHAAFAAARHIKFPLLSDFEPKGEVARSYGVFRSSEGVADRALFVIDALGIIRWCFVSPLNEVPGADGVLKTLETLSPQKGVVKE